MTPIPSGLAEPPTVEQGVAALIEDVKHKVHSSYESCEDRVRRSPGKAILVAAAAGYCLHRLPVRSLLVTQVRLMAALAPPALFAFGAAKLCEFLQNEARR
ncbi:MAG: hypothetical protein ABIS50_01560 [Luteolibacter sp.]|uniref:hypothetical protein n=1 Tax=Luteolibacter sp. TaxID=1962973 RepID=UPI0032647331